MNSLLIIKFMVLYLLSESIIEVINDYKYQNNQMIIRWLVAIGSVVESVS